ncbi:MAG TPA: ATP synthase F1 subunit delta [Candidatus Saccharimonadales bacterium]|nr:ATP synthase F1 subunit delta [Candidatus Saccharimonadales bacterium]
MNHKFSRRIIARTVAAKLLSEPARQDHWVKVLAAYLVDQHREQEADLILNDLAHELFVQNGQLAVSVTSARPLSEAVRASLQALLAEQTNAKTVELSETIDPTLLGGLIAQTPDAVMDVSVRSQLNQLASLK